MNRAVIIVAVFAFVVLVLCGGWLLWHGPTASRRGAVNGDNDLVASQSENASHAPRVTTSGSNQEPAGNVAANTETGPGNSSNAPANTPPTPQKPQKPPHDFRGPERPQPVETEHKKPVVATISGRVQDERTAPVANADIYVEVVALRRLRGTPDPQSTPLAKMATSDKDGAFDFSIECEIFESATLTAYVSARARGYGPSPVAVVEATVGGAFSTTLTLREGGAVKGRVVDTHGNPVVGVKVALGKQVQMAKQPAHTGEYFEALTDGVGVYKFEDVAVGAYPIGVLSLAHNYRSGPKDVNAVHETGTLEDLVVEVVISIRLRVTDASGGQVQGVCKIIFREGKDVKSRQNAVVPEEGVLVLARPPVGTYDVTIQVEGYFESTPARLTFTLGQITDAGTIVVTKDPSYVRQH